MERIVVFCVGALLSVTSEIFWKGESRPSMALWGGLGMLLLRRLVLRFGHASRALLCLAGAALLVALRLTLLILEGMPGPRDRNKPKWVAVELPSLSYISYRFLLIAPAYTIIEYLEACFRM